MAANSRTRFVFLFPPLLVGRAVVMVPEQGDGHGDGFAALAALIASGESLGPLKLTPAHIDVLHAAGVAPRPGRVHSIVVGGEPLLGEHIVWCRAAAPGARIFNEYGPTETTVGCSDGSSETSLFGGRQAQDDPDQRGRVKETTMTITFKALAALLAYPNLVAAMPEILDILEGDRRLPRRVRADHAALVDELRSMDPLHAQERYVATFDRGRAACLHLFEHVHGESRDRGQAMVDLKSM